MLANPKVLGYTKVVTEKHITSNLAIHTLQKALAEHPNIKEGLILHSGRGSQFTSKAFIEFCQSVQITQSMSKAGALMTTLS